MNHHTNKQYLLENIKILEWFLSTETGLQCTYEIDGITYHLLASPFRLTTLLSNVYLINDRRLRDGCLQVQRNDVWMPFSWYVTECHFDTIDLVLICSEHEQSKSIMEISDTYIAARMKPLNYN
jgi:hypothetical protein